MALSISLSNDEGKPYTPGSMVLGVVKSTTYDDQIIKSLNIEFKGITNVFLNQNYGDLVVSRTDYVSKSYLFSRHFDLCSGGCIQQKGTYAWPFAFRIPLFAAPRALPPGSKEFFHPKHPWKSDGTMESHPLPPSMQQRTKFVCEVQYVLEATFVHWPTEKNHPKSRNGRVQALRTIPVQSLDITSHALSGGDWPYFIHRHTVRCRLAESSYRLLHQPLLIFSRKSQSPKPEVKFRFSVLMPKKLELKERQALSIPVSCSMDGPEAAQLLAPSILEGSPAHVFCSFKLSLVEHTHVRAGCHTSSSDKRIFTRKGSGEVPISVVNISASETARDTPSSFVNLCDTADLTIPAEVLSGDFSTYNIARFHSLDISFCMEYEKKKYKFSLRTVPIRVVSQPGGEFEKRLSEGLDADDEYGCDLAGIQWRNYSQNTSGTGDDSEEILYAMAEGSSSDCDLIPEIPPPAYSA